MAYCNGCDYAVPERPRLRVDGTLIHCESCGIPLEHEMEAVIVHMSAGNTYGWCDQCRASEMNLRKRVLKPFGVPYCTIGQIGGSPPYEA